MKAQVLTGAVLAAVLVCATGCGASPSSVQLISDEPSETELTFDRFNELPDDQRTDALIEAAREEGEVVAYLRSVTVAPELERAFEEKYGVDLTIRSPGANTIVRQQVLEQSRAGALTADLIETYSYELELIYGDSNVASEVPDFLKRAASSPDLVSDHGIETFQYPFLPVWNTDQVLPGQAPKSWEDFLSPQWANRLVMVKNYEVWYYTVFQYLTDRGMTADEFENLFKSIARNASTTDSSNPAAAFTASGQYLAGVNIALTSIQKIGESAPLAWEPSVEPVVLSPLGIGLFKEAPHPAAALLFSQWYLTEGQEILQKEQYVDQSPTETDLADSVKVRPNSGELTVERLQAWREAYEELITGGDHVLPDYIRGA